jgi:hypothetical protein
MRRRRRTVCKKEKKKIHGPACMNATKGFAM